MGCVTVNLNEDATQKHKQITMYSWCSKCKEFSKSVTMQTDTYCLSFGKYLELRFHGHAYRCRDLRMDTDSADANADEKICTHSLHRDHVQYFSYNGMVASFSYASVEVWEISLPSLKLQLKVHKTNEKSARFDEIKAFASRGYEVFATIYERLAQILSNDVEFPSLTSLKKTVNHDQLAFREKVNVVQSLLTTDTSANVYEINDAVFTVKKTLADSIEAWTQRLTEATIKYRAICATASKTEATAPATPSPAQQSNNNSSSEMSDDPIVDSGTICTEDLRSDLESSVDSTNSNLLLSREVSVDSENSSTPKTNTADASTSSVNQVVERDVKSSTSTDKKSVKTILRELIPSEKPIQPLPSPIPINENVSLAIGIVPVLVHDQDFSSVIAYCLASNDYKRKLDSLSFCDVHRKSYDGTTDTEDASSPATNAKESEKEKKLKPTQTHIEMNFQDSTTSTQFTCKAYFARDFDLMRNKLLTLPDDDSNILFYSRHSSVESETKASKDFDRKSSNNSLNCDTTKCDEKCDDTPKKDVDKARVAFIRSLSQSVRWEARGGKSGSKFCKTMGKAPFSLFFGCFYSSSFLYLVSFFIM